jgi:hypothetical protein
MVRYYRINLRLRKLMRQQQSDITNDISLDDGYELLGRKLEVFGQPLATNSNVPGRTEQVYLRVEFLCRATSHP